MAKNILIFSDGTGQAGGLTPDQRLSNVYKLFRASRLGPDNAISAAEQVAFYDPGLGSAGDVGKIRLKIYLAIRKFASSATGAGIGKNITDCYEAIIKHYEPGDRVYLFGFSRGAYTARCVAGVMRLCGVPRSLEDGTLVPRYGSALRAIASEAVHKVYEHGSGRRRAEFEVERRELASRFRAKYGCGTPDESNVSPYFIGVFDTVAALGASGVKAFLMNLALLVGLSVVPLAIAGLAWLTVGTAFWLAFGFAAAATAAVAGVVIARQRIRYIAHYPPAGRLSFHWHWTGWRFKNYDTNLDRRVRFARHAVAIDETRADFARVPWGQPSEGVDPITEGEPQRFEQIWFAGNHSDIGGSYAEDESRLSDISLGWMTAQMKALPAPVLLDESKLHLSPSPAGMQHSEVENMLDAYPSWWPRRLRRTWNSRPRYAASGAPYHPSVLERLALPSVLQSGRYAPYRPDALSKDTNLRVQFPDGWGS